MHVGERAARAGPAGKHARGCSCRPVPDCFLGDTPNSASFSCLRTKGGLAEDERNNVLAACRHRNGVCGECASGCLLSFCPVPSAVLALVPCPAAGTCGRHPACTKARIPGMGHGARDGGCRSAVWHREIPGSVLHRKRQARLAEHARTGTVVRTGAEPLPVCPAAIRHTLLHTFVCLFWNQGASEVLFTHEVLSQRTDRAA